MRIIKNADVRKNEILDAAAKLFTEKGYDSTSTNDILDAVGIARGTLYHHFKSKEDIMDGLVTRQVEQIVADIQEVALDKSIPVFERLTKTILTMNVSKPEHGNKTMMEHLHRPQNALMHQKTNQMVMKQIPPILAGIVEDGIAKGIFKTDYPLECMELTFIYLTTICDDGIFTFTEEQLSARIHAFIFHLEKILGTKHGELDFLSDLLGSEVIE